MALNRPDDGLLTFLTAVGLNSSSLETQFKTIADQLTELKGASDAQAAVARAIANTTAPPPSATGAVDSALSTLGTVGSFVTGGAGLVSLFAGLIEGVSGNDAATPSGLARFVAPSSIRLEAGLVGNTAVAVDTTQGNLPRMIAAAAQPQQIVIQVQAMDSRSFLDHSNDIALAVRQAMLETAVLNDVIREV